jgi:hypothetical protein
MYLQQAEQAPKSRRIWRISACPAPKVGHESGWRGEALIASLADACRPSSISPLAPIARKRWGALVISTMVVTVRVSSLRVVMIQVAWWYERNIMRDFFMSVTAYEVPT